MKNTDNKIFSRDTQNKKKNKCFSLKLHIENGTLVVKLSSNFLSILHKPILMSDIRHIANRFYVRIPYIHTNFYKSHLKIYTFSIYFSIQTTIWCRKETFNGHIPPTYIDIDILFYQTYSWLVKL